MSSAINLASLMLQLKQQQTLQQAALKTAEEQELPDSVAELRQALQETRYLLARLGAEVIYNEPSNTTALSVQETGDSSDPNLAEMLNHDVEALSLQLRCNLATEDRPHMGRIYLQSFAGEDAISWLEKHADVERLKVLGKSMRHTINSEQAGRTPSPGQTPEVSPSSSRSASPSPSPSPRASPRGVRRRRALGIGRSEAVWVANELVRKGEWQQLTGTTALDKRIDKGSGGLAECSAGAATQSHAHSGGNQGQPDGYMTPAGRRFQPHNSLLQFTLFRMRTAPALNERYKWSVQAGRDPVAVTCHLLGLIAHLPLDDVGASLMEDKLFKHFESATAELQRVEYTGLGAAGLTCFLINLHNIMVVHGHCRFYNWDKVRDEDRRMFMQAVRYRIGTSYWSLVDLNLVLRTRFVKTSRIDPRVHFTLSYGSVSSPPIRCYTREALPALLDQAARDYCRPVQVVHLDKGHLNPYAGSHQVWLPIGFKYFAADLARTRRELLLLVARYAPAGQRVALEAVVRDERGAAGGMIDLRYLPSDWALALSQRTAPILAPLPHSARPDHPLDAVHEHVHASV